MNSTFADALFRHAIGLDSLQRFADSAAKATNYPPHNIEQITEDHYRLTIAVAGFSQGDIALTLHNGVLTVTGAAKKDDAATVYVYRGIANRSFERQFKLGEHIEVLSATMENGLLVIDLMRQVPEAQKPKCIPLSFGKRPA